MASVPPRLPVDPLNVRQPIVDPETGAPNGYFLRLWERLFGNDSNTFAGLASKADKATVLTAGVGLAGGGDLSADRTFDLEDTTVTPGVYGDASNVPQITVDQQGRITDVQEVAIAGGGGGAGGLPKKRRVQWTVNNIGQLSGGDGYNITQTGTSVVSAASSGSSVFNSYPRQGRQTGAINNANAVISTTAASGYFYRGAAALVGGFTWNMAAGFVSGLADSRWWMGVRDDTTFTGNPSAFLNCIGVGCDAGDANLHVMHNDGAGSATKINLGADFPARGAAADLYLLELSCAPNGSDVTYTVTRLNTGDVATGTINADLPAGGTALRTFFGVNAGPSGAGGAAVAACFWHYAEH